jgi:uncharacterized protein (DUF849 family)
VNGVLIAALNGGSYGHAGVPVSPDELAADAVRAVSAGATEVHVHPRRVDGLESLDPPDVDTAMEAISSAIPGVPVSVTTGAWIEADPRRRAALIAHWQVVPTYASVNLHEDGAAGLARVLSERGVGVEAGIFSVAAAEWFVRGPVRSLATRILIEPVDRPALLAVNDASAIMAVLDRHRVELPRILHGDGPSTWPVLRQARSLGLGLRIGFEDTFDLPDGTPAPSNVALVHAARTDGEQSWPRARGW